MILMIGGAFQGKLDFAREHLGVTDCFTCDGPEIDFSSGCVRKLKLSPPVMRTPWCILKPTGTSGGTVCS